MFTNKNLNVVILLTSLIAYISISYFIPRTNFVALFSTFTFLFLGYIFLLKAYTEDNKRVFFVSGIIFRLALLFFIPNLSDDFYRFIWDGQLIKLGINPLQYLPSELIGNLPNREQIIMPILYDGLNATNTYTCYPPLNQVFFYLGAIFSKWGLLYSVIAMKAVILFAEIGNYYLLKKLLVKLNVPVKNMFLYWLNPLIIIEFTGNMHYEGIMIFLLLCSFLTLLNNRFILSAIFFALSVSVKLIPLMFLPAYLWYLGFKKWFLYSTIVMLLTVLFFLPFLGFNSYFNFFTSLDLYFQKFEFNASIYYLIREIGYWYKGYNIIQTAGIYMLIISFVSIVYIGIMTKNKEFTNMLKSMLFMISIYYFLSLIVHPWYIGTLIMFSVFTNYSYSIMWSFLIFLSYATYQTSAYTENMILLTVEYLLVFVVLYLEITKNAFYQKLIKSI